MDPVVARWTGREAKALREAKRLSLRDYAAHLGISDVTLSNLERKGADAQLRWETQQLLDADLSRASRDVQERFALLLNSGQPHTSTSDPAQGPALDGLGGTSAARTATLLTAFNVAADEALQYMSDRHALEHLRQFCASRSRVYLIKGPAGSGKTRLIRHVAELLADASDFQLHTAASWDAGATHLAAEVLRYGSRPTGVDPLLTLERAAADLTRPCLVVMDGINTRDRLDQVFRQVDALIRQSPEDRLRFVLVVRTPPEPDLSAFPMIAATLHARGTPDASFTTSPWDTPAAREAWNRSRGADAPAFDELPAAAQALARLPLYMRLLRAAGTTDTPGDLSSYRLVDHCMKSILATSGRDADLAADVLGDLAIVEAGHLLPSLALPALHDARPMVNIDALSPLVEMAPDGRATFVHDVIREYFLATRMARSAVDQGRTRLIAIINDLAARAAESAVAQGLFQFTVHAIDDTAPELVASVALAPTVATGTTLPAMLDVAADGARFATPDVLRACARRCTSESTLELARSLLRQTLLADALGEEHVAWILAVLRMFGSAIWADVAGHVERSFDADMAARLVSQANLDAPEEATFLARHVFLLTNDHDQTGLLDRLLGHPDWRVRGSIAESLSVTGEVGAPLVEACVDRLVVDEDYKVRAGIARVLARAEPALVKRHLGRLLGDPVWHVRACVLEGLSNWPRSHWAVPVSDVLDAISAEASWQRSPEHVSRLLERLLLLEGKPTMPGQSAARAHALFRLLREIRTGWAAAELTDRQRLLAEGLASTSWLVKREARALDDRATFEAVATNAGSPGFREAYRRLRGDRRLQVALDLRDLELATEVAMAAVRAGADFIEVGDPLIKAAGLAAVETIKRHVPEAVVVAEMMSADWGRDQVESAVEHGADVVLLIGPATAASVAAAADAGHRLGAVILLDVPPAQATQAWIRAMERSGVDGFVVTTNIDLGVGVHQPLTRARAIRGWTHLPVAVSGGFSATDHAIINNTDWDIMIVGRGVAESVRPEEATEQMVRMVRGIAARTRR